jgi:xanthine dehydrogenase YagR molybdenum-binding subunit
MGSRGRPRLKALQDALRAKYLDSPHRAVLPTQRSHVFDREQENHRALYREANIPRETDLAGLAQQYEKVLGGMTVTFRGGEYTLAQMAPFGEDPDRTLRREAWELEVETYTDILKRHKKESVEVTQESKPGEEGKKFSMYAFGAQFVEVRVDPDLGTVRVARVVSALAAGRIINPKTAHSQAVGGIVGGLGMALLEEGVRDRRNGGMVNANLEQYMVPVNADVPELDVCFVDEVDKHVNPIGAKGLAELSLVGVAPAVANAVYHATGKRVRDLPITLDKLL